MPDKTIDPLQAAYERACAEVRLSTERCRVLDPKPPYCAHVAPLEGNSCTCTEYLLAELLREMRTLRAALLAYLLPGER